MKPLQAWNCYDIVVYRIELHYKLMKRVHEESIWIAEDEVLYNMGIIGKTPQKVDTIPDSAYHKISQ